MNPERALDGIRHLRELHRDLDNAVLAAYGWAEPLSPESRLVEVETLAENDRVRLTISPAARTELLRRLLALNHSRTEQGITPGPTSVKRRSRKPRGSDTQGSLQL